MSNKALHEGYVIQSAPRYLAERAQWQLCVVISFNRCREMRPREFSPETFYLTEPEADTYGIAFGRDLIDGKLAGLSVADMKLEKRHEIRRYNVQFPTVVSEYTKHDASGLMLDLSRSGCQLKSQSTIATGRTVELQVQVPGAEKPLVIDGARVRWVKEQIVGLTFVRIRQTEKQRLERVIADLRIRGSGEAA
jgi:hypothetical protein